MLDHTFLQTKFGQALPFASYIATGTGDQRNNWQRMHDRVSLAPQQSALLGGFVRQMNVLVTSGLWCGDCAQQCPMFAKIAAASGGKIDLRFLDRDKNMDLADRVRICGGNRVPTVIFMAEDFEFVSLLGDQTLARLRSKAAKALGEYCPLPGAELAEDELGQTLQEWANEYERVQLTLRLSSRLRDKHGD